MLNSNDDIETLKDDDLKESVSEKFDNIRFPQYRIACKLRHLQKISKFYLIDLFNTIESFREFGLNGEFDLKAQISSSRIHTIIDSIYTHLLQRIPSTQKLDVDWSVDIIYNWLLDTFDIMQTGFISTFAFKIALTVLCSSSLSNKLCYLFTLLSNNEENLIETQFACFLYHLLTIPKYFEDISNFEYRNDLHSTLFNFDSPVNVHTFVETLTFFDNHVDFKSWLIVYNRLTDAETVFHPILCNPCGKNSFYGFRYKCKKCSNYNLCQDCFWTGKHSDNHDSNKHQCKEYLFDKSKNQLKSLRSSFRKSFRCFPTKQRQEDFLNSNQINLTKRLKSKPYILSPKHEKSDTFSSINEYKFHDPPLGTSFLQICNQNTTEDINLISNYLYELNSKDNYIDQNFSRDITGSDSVDFQLKIENLENINRELAKSITDLKELKSNDNRGNKSPITSSNDNVFFDELLLLRRKKDDLENHLDLLQNKKKILMDQLDNLMKEYNQNDDQLNVTGESLKHNDSLINTDNTIRDFIH